MGYFFAGSNAGGLISQYCTREPPAPVTERLSGREKVTSFRQERFSSVRARTRGVVACWLVAPGDGDFSSNDKEKISAGAVSVVSVKTTDPGPARRLPIAPPFFRSLGAPPARDTSKRSFLPSSSAVKYTVRPSLLRQNSETERSGSSNRVRFAFVFRS